MEIDFNPIKAPEILDAMKVLSKYGFGIMKVHMHDNSGQIVPLEDGKVQYEKGLKVSFVDENLPELCNAIPVGWHLKDGKAKVFAHCCAC
jgi:hypothetical protein